MQLLPLFLLSFLTYIFFLEGNIDVNAVSFPNKVEENHANTLDADYKSLRKIDIDTTKDAISKLLLTGNFPALKSIKVKGNSPTFEADVTGSFASLQWIDILSTSGDITLDLEGRFSNDIKITIRATSADVRLILPQDFGYSIRVVSTSGEVFYNSHKVSRSYNPLGRGQKFFSIGYKENMPHFDIEINVTSGNVHLS